MQSLKVADIKKELLKKSSAELAELCLALAKYKVENKELLTYLLMDANDEPSYIKACMLEIDDMFEELNRSNYYLIKKGLRKIIRITSKRIKYSGKKETEIELFLYFISKSLEEKIKTDANQVTLNMYISLFKKIEKSISMLHEDLQFDFKRKTDPLKHKIIPKL